MGKADFGDQAVQSREHWEWKCLKHSGKAKGLSRRGGKRLTDRKVPSTRLLPKAGGGGGGRQPCGLPVLESPTNGCKQHQDSH